MKIWTWIHIPPLFIMAKIWNSPNVQILYCINTFCDIHKVEYYAAMKIKLLLHTTIWMTLTDVMMRDWSQTQQPITMWFHWCDVQEQVKLINDDRSQNSGCILVEGGVKGG